MGLREVVVAGREPRSGVPGHGKQTILLSATTAFAQGLAALSMLLAARASSPASFGEAAAVISVGLTATGLLDFGVTGFSVRQYANGTASGGETSARLVGKVVATLPVAAAGSTIAWLVAPGTLYWLAGPIAATAVIGQILRVPLQSAALSHRAGLALVVDRTAILAVLGLLMAASTPAPTALVVASCVGALFGAAAAWMLTPGSWRLEYPSTWINPWRGTSGFGVFGLAVSASALDLPLLAHSAGAAAAGLYGAVQRWVSPMGLLGNAYSSSAAPFVARADSARDAWRAQAKSVWILFTAAGVTLLVAVFAGALTNLLLGPAYAGAGELLRILALATMVAIFNQPLAAFLMNRGRDGHVAVVTGLVVALQLLAIVVLAPSYGASVAPAAFLGVQIALGLAYATILFRSRRTL